MLNRSRFILLAMLGAAFALTTSAYAAPAPTTRPAASAAGAMEGSAVDTAALPPAAKGKLENEPIRRKPAGSGKAALPTTAAANSSTKGPAVPVSSGLDFSRVLMALGIVLALIFVMRWIGKRFLMGPTGGKSSRAIQVISRTILSPKQHLLLLQVGQRVLVVADSGGQMSSLSEITDPDEIASLIGRIAEEKSNAAGVPSFNGLVGRFRGGFERETRDEADGVESSKPTDSVELDGGSHRGTDAVEDPALASTQDELKGLMRKARLLAGQYKTSS